MPKISVDLTKSTYDRFHERCESIHQKHAGAVRMLIDLWLGHAPPRSGKNAEIKH